MSLGDEEAGKELDGGGHDRANGSFVAKDGEDQEDQD